MEEAERAARDFPRKGAIVRPMRNIRRNGASTSPSSRTPTASAIDGTDADAAVGRRGRGPPPGARLLRFPKREAPGFAIATSSTSRRSSASARRGASPARYQLSGDDVSRARASPTPSASTAGRSRRMWPATWNGAGPTSRARAASTTCPTACWCRSASRNLLVAGRCASMTHEGQSAARVSGGCFVMGEAVGTAAHLALAGNVAPAEIACRRVAGRARSATARISGRS